MKATIIILNSTLIVLVIIAIILTTKSDINTMTNNNYYREKAVVVATDYYDVILETEDGNVWVIEANGFIKGDNVMCTFDNNDSLEIEDDEIIECEKK